MKSPIPVEDKITLFATLNDGENLEVVQCENSVFISIGNEGVALFPSEAKILLQALPEAIAFAESLEPLKREEVPDDGWIVAYRRKGHPFGAPTTYTHVDGKDVDNAAKALFTADKIRPNGLTWHSIYRNGKILISLAQLRKNLNLKLENFS